MKRRKHIVYSISILLLLPFVLGCAQDQTSSPDRQALTPSSKADSMVTENGDTIINSDRSGVISKSWIDSLLGNYILLSRNDLVKAAVKENLSEEWTFDQIVNTDTATYFAYAIGHDVSDKGGANLRFITDQWVYVDTATRVLYEYMPDDRLICWSK